MTYVRASSRGRGRVARPFGFALTGRACGFPASDSSRELPALYPSELALLAGVLVDEVGDRRRQGGHSRRWLKYPQRLEPLVASAMSAIARR